MAIVAKKLHAEGFTVAGRQLPKGLVDHATIIVTDAGTRDVLRIIGGSSQRAACEELPLPGARIYATLHGR